MSLPQTRAEGVLRKSWQSAHAIQRKDHELRVRTRMAVLLALPTQQPAVVTATFETTLRQWAWPRRTAASSWRLGAFCRVVATPTSAATYDFAQKNKGFQDDAT